MLGDGNAESATLFGEGKTHAAEINVSGTKGAVGHLLGAAGSVEAVWSVLAMKDVSIPRQRTIAIRVSYTDNC